MPHVNSSGGDDLASTDEVKVYKDEGEEEKRSSENLSEDKLGLVTESEEVRKLPIPSVLTVGPATDISQTLSN
jgi:transcription factor 7-like 2